MATLRKTEFFYHEIAGKLGTYHGCYLDHFSVKKIVDEISLDKKM